jgi:protoporphyrinogen/coproporphyrinogen III oxidase
MGVKAEPMFHNIARWPNSMAQYTVGHAKRVERIEGLTRSIHGLYLAGNAYHGIGIPDCVRLGQEAAAKIIAGCKPELQPA